MTQKVLVSVIGILVGFILIGGTFIGLRLRETYRMQTEIEQVQLAIETHLSEHKGRQDAVSDRLDELERALFGEIYAKVAKLTTKPAPTPSSMFRNIETLMFTRDKELQSRLERLERWRMGFEKDESKPRPAGR